MKTKYFYCLELCDNGGFFHGGKCFNKANGCASFNEAKNICTSQTRNSKLLHITNKDTSNFFTERISNATWLGLSKSLTDSKWYWQNGASLNFTNWHEGQPTNNSFQCSAVTKEANKTGWQEQDCASCQEIICEKGIDTRIFEESLRLYKK